MDTKSDFEKALKFIHPIEGFVSDDPRDSGGLTIFGISSKSHKEIVMKMLKLLEVGKKDEAYQIAKSVYYDEYWVKAGCPTLPFPFSVVVFDTAVNCGVGTAKKILFKFEDWRDFLLLRIEHHTNCETASDHMWGWSRRVISLYNYVKREGGEK